MIQKIRPLLPNNHFRLDVDAFQFPLAATDVIVFRQAVIEYGQYAFLDVAAFLVHRVAERIDQILDCLDMPYVCTAESQFAVQEV